MNIDCSPSSRLELFQALCRLVRLSLAFGMLLYALGPFVLAAVLLFCLTVSKVQAADTTLASIAISSPVASWQTYSTGTATVNGEPHKESSHRTGMSSRWASHFLRPHRPIQVSGKDEASC